MQDERLEYIHNNPVAEGIVWRPEDYIYSSASYYCGKKDCILEIDVIGLMNVEFARFTKARESEQHAPEYTSSLVFILAIINIFNNFLSISYSR